MPRRILKNTIRAHHHIRRCLRQPHCELCQRFSWYDWWHKQDFHTHVHYAAMVCGIITAVYFIMLDEIFSKVNL